MIPTSRFERRRFVCRALMAVGGRVVASILPRRVLGSTLSETAAQQKADYALKIQPTSVELGPGIVVKTTAYNGQVPGPILRLREGVPVAIDVSNASANPDLVHWHGLAIDSRSE